MEKAAGALKGGHVSGIVKSLFVHHLLKREKVTAVPERPFEAVKKEICQRLQGQKFNDLVKTTESSLKVETDDKLLQSLDLSTPLNL